MTEKEKECDCENCEYCKKVIEGTKEFVFKALIIYVGVTLAIITSANILKPKHHFCPGFRPMPGIERPIPGPMMHHFRHHPFKAQRGDFKGQRVHFNKEIQQFPKDNK